MSLAMEKIEVEVPKELKDVGLWLAAVVVEVKRAKADGEISAGEYPEIVMNTVTQLMTAFNGIQDVLSLLKSNPVSSVLGVIVPVAAAFEAKEKQIIKLSNSMRKELGYDENLEEDEDEDEEESSSKKSKKK